MKMYGAEWRESVRIQIENALLYMYYLNWDWSWALNREAQSDYNTEKMVKIHLQVKREPSNDPNPRNEPIVIYTLQRLQFM